jgi:hypothetical protein
MSIFFVIFAAILLIAIVVGVRELRSQGLPRGAAQVDIGVEGGTDFHADGSPHATNCDFGSHDGGHCGFDGGGEHH